jgi:hypothetical protein
MFGGKPGEAARLFSIVAYGLACLAFQPGGSRFGPHRWEANPERADPAISDNS